MWYNNLLENNRLPDWAIRQGIRWYNTQHLKRLNAGRPEELAQKKEAVFTQLSQGPLAVAVDAANAQHYELPPAFFEAVLGPHLKYSCGYWKSGSVSLAQSEADMLELYCQRAQLNSARSILELGCGWGSLSLYMAKKYPHTRIRAISNSQGQRQHIEARARAAGLRNLSVETVDINHFDPKENFDRIVSIEMFEHLRNYQTLFERLNTWLNPGGLLFVHIFNHVQHAYLFEPEHERDWMARYFFTGGTMPSQDLLPHFAQPMLQLKNIWPLNGQHYARTSNAWLHKMDHHRIRVWPLLEQTYGKTEALKWWVYWRVFFMACAELFAHQQGEAWQVTHYLFEKNT